MRIVAITSKVGDIVQPTQAVIVSEPELAEYWLLPDKARRSAVVKSINPRLPLPIEVVLNGDSWYFEQHELEQVEA